MKRVLGCFLFLILFFNAVSQDKPAYQLFTVDGKRVKYKKMMKDIIEARIFFFGEHHNNPISHWLQLEILNDLYDVKKSKLKVGAEMFESDNQLIIDEYFNDIISEDNFIKEVRLWPNYETDYRPLVEYMKEKNIPLIATNCPRRYASLVYKKGMKALEQLDSVAKKFLPNLPIEFDKELQSYKKMLKMMGGHGSETLIEAQALKDASMAYFIRNNFEENTFFYHINGAYHSDFYEGIVWFVKKFIPEKSIRTLTTVEQLDMKKLDEENLGIADYILVVNPNMTKTH